MNTIHQLFQINRHMWIGLSVVAGAVVFFASTPVADAQSPQGGSGERLVTIHDDGRERSILTRATTLRQLFDQVGIYIDANDLVEPGLDEKLVAGTYEANIYRAQPITIVDGSAQTKIMSPYRTAKQIARHAGIVLHDEDETSMRMSTGIVSGLGVDMVIDRATPFTFVLYGKKEQDYSQARTVGDMLDRKGVRLGVADVLSVSRDTPLTADMTVELWRNGKQTITEEYVVAYDTDRIKDYDHEPPYKLIKTPGVPGKRAVTYEVDMKNGQEVSRTEIQSIVIEEPKRQVEVVGAKITNTFSGDFAGALERLRSCEAGGRYDRNSGNGYYGAYQYDISTWGGYMGYANASLAPAEVQDQKVWETYRRRGWNPWPSCKVKMGLQDIYR